MDDLSKLEHLLSHWIEHNVSHEEGYAKWVEKLDDAGESQVAEEIRKALEQSRQMSRHFKKAGELLKGENHV
jgi:hypothetical protein